MNPSISHSCFIFRSLIKSSRMASCLVLTCLFLISSSASAQEQVYVHTDKNEYVGGETIQFKAYLFADANNTNASKQMYFQLTGSSKIELADLRTEVKEGVCSGLIHLPTHLATGYYLFSAYTNGMRNYPLQTYFHKKILIINPSDASLDSIVDFSLKETLSKHQPQAGATALDCQLSSLKKKYSTREKVTFDLQLASLSKDDVAHLSISVSEQSPVEDSTLANRIIDYRGSLLQEWADLKAKAFIHPHRYLVENRGYVLIGELRNKTTHEPISNATILLSTPDSVANLLYYKTNKDGAFYFKLDQFYDNKTIYYQLSDSFSLKTNAEIKLDDKRITPSLTEISKQQCSALTKSYMETSQKIAITNKVFHLNEPSDSDLVNAPVLKTRYPFYGIPDLAVVPADYEALPDFEEVVRNITWGVSMSKKKVGYQLRMLDLESKSMQDPNAFLLINTIPIFNYSVLMQFSSATIRKIEMQRKHILYGDLNLYGVFSLFTSDKLASDIYTKLEIPHFQNKVMTPKQYATKGNESPSSLTPDFRQSLYWNPDVKLSRDKKESISFYTSDLKATYQIVVQGMTASKTPIYAKYTIEVK